MVFISNNDPRIDLVGKPEWIGFCKRFFFVKVDPNNPLDRNNWDSLDAIRFECDLEATSRMPLRSYLLPKTGNQWSLAQIHFANPSHPDNIRIREQCAFRELLNIIKKTGLLCQLHRLHRKRRRWTH